MILAGDIGATRTRLAAFETEGSRLECVVEKTYASQEHAGLQEVLVQFIRTEGIPVHSACFGVAGPVRNGKSKISNLPWTIDCQRTRDATQAQLCRPAERSRSLRLRHRCPRVEGLHHAERRDRKMPKGTAQSSRPEPDSEWPGFSGTDSAIIRSRAKAAMRTLHPEMPCRPNC